MRIPNIIASIIGLLLSVATFLGTLYFPKFPIPLAGPDFFPKLLAILLGILSIALLIQSMFKREPFTEEILEKEIEPKQKIFWKMVMAMGFSVLYFLGLSIFGYLICTFSYFAFLMFLMQSKKRILKTIVWSLGTTAVTYLLFGVVLRATLPVGKFFR